MKKVLNTTVLVFASRKDMFEAALSDSKIPHGFKIFNLDNPTFVDPFPYPSGKKCDWDGIKNKAKEAFEKLGWKVKSVSFTEKISTISEVREDSKKFI